MSAKRDPVRCAVYTRKSTEEGLDQEFNSLDAQRESAESYIASQKNEGWECLPERYDDGGFSGGTVERPALKRLLDDIEAGRIDCVVVYKVDRLSRSLLDFSKLMDAFDKNGVSFVSVTQQFNTTHSMGRLTLNILLSFAQFEREIISERTRDKIAAARRKGKWAGGKPVLGYDVVRRPGGNTLAINPEEAEAVRKIFDLYLEHGRAMPVVEACREHGWTTKAWTAKTGRVMGGMPLSKNRLLSMLKNPVYAGKVRHHDQIYEGEHEAIIEQAVFDRVAEQLAANASDGGTRACNAQNALLKGLVHCAACDCPMYFHPVTSKTKHGQKRYHYYCCSKAQKHGWKTCPGASLPAGDLEAFVIDQIQHVVTTNDAVCAIAERAIETLKDRQPYLPVDPDEVVGVAEVFTPVWEALAQREKEDLIRLLIERIDWDPAEESVSVTFHDGIPLPDTTDDQEAAA